MDVSDTRRVVILGKTGAGKSSLANTTFGEGLLFNTSHTINSETRKCQAETRSLNGRSITLIDTPGFFDTDRPEEELKPEIVRCIIECAPGPHAFLIVLKVEKFTEHEQAVINKIDQYFSEEVFKYATIVFTHGDQLEEGQKIEDFVRQNKSMSDLVKKCGGRCHVIDNKYWKNNQQDEYRSNKCQVEKILNTIDEITKANKGRCYTNEMLQVVQEIIEQNIRESSGNMSEEEITRQAKDKTFKKILIKLAGVGTGTVLGALFGAVAMVVAVVYTLKVLVPAARAALLAAAAGTGGTAAGVAATGAVAVGETAAGATATAAGAVAVGGTAAAEAAAAAAAGGGAAGVAGTAAAAGGGAAGGGAAVAGGLGATGIAFISTAAVSAAVGAAVGGYKGYNAAEGADTPWEAAKMAAAAVKEGAFSIKSTIDEVGDSLKTLNVSSKSTYSKLKES